MRLSFPTLGQVDANATTDALALHQMRLRDKKATGLIEVSLDPPKRLLLLLAHGTLTGSYLTENGSCRRILAADIPAEWDTGTRPVRVIPLPDKAGRAAWMACECAGQRSLRGADESAWGQQERAWNHEALTGLVEVISASAQGFLFYQKGEMLELESVWLNSNETASSPILSDLAGGWEVTILESPAADTAQRSFALRRAALAWSKNIFESYQNIAGEKFLHVMLRELQTQVRPWQWNIRVEEKGFLDEHFFPSPEATAHAYRALFMGMGAQMGFAIGGYLTQRILSEMFEELHRDERDRLEDHRLIPAAFSE